MPTRAQAEAVLVGAAPDAGAGLVGGLLKRIGHDATGPSPVASLADAISEGLIECGVMPADPTNPTDADMASLPASAWPKFRDIAEIRLLDLASGGGAAGAAKSVSWEDFSKSVATPADEAKALLATKRMHALRRWGYGAASLRAGSYRVGGGTCTEF
jgi:hypothetical protein